MPPKPLGVLDSSSWNSLSSGLKYLFCFVETVWTGARAEEELVVGAWAALVVVGARAGVELVVGAWAALVLVGERAGEELVVELVLGAWELVAGERAGEELVYSRAVVVAASLRSYSSSAADSMASISLSGGLVSLAKMLSHTSSSISVALLELCSS